MAHASNRSVAASRTHRRSGTSRSSGISAAETENPSAMANRLTSRRGGRAEAVLESGAVRESEAVLESGAVRESEAVLEPGVSARRTDATVTLYAYKPD